MSFGWRDFDRVRGDGSMSRATSIRRIRLFHNSGRHSPPVNEDLNLSVVGSTLVGNRFGQPGRAVDVVGAACRVRRPIYRAGLSPGVDPANPFEADMYSLMDSLAEVQRRESYNAWSQYQLVTAIAERCIAVRGTLAGGVVVSGEATASSGWPGSCRSPVGRPRS